MAKPPGTLLLASGLSVLRGNSFARQLRLLKRFLELSGVRVLLTGREPLVESDDPPNRLSAGGTGPDIFDLPDFSAGAISTLVSKYGIAAVILLGYPDQFPFLLSTVPVPVYFWYQCSRPLLPPGLESTVVVPLTEKTAAHLRLAGLAAPGPVIPHGVDTRVFSPAPEHTTSEVGTAGEAVLLSVGANSIRKRFDLLIDVFARVKERLPGVRLMIKTDSGDKPGGFDLSELALRYGVSGEVTILSSELSDPEMASLYLSSDIYVHTAEWEGFCIPVVEAMACGLPVITHPVQGPGELVPYPEYLVRGSRAVREGETELLRADPGSFADAIVRFAEDPGIVRDTAAAGRRAAVERFDMRKVVEQWRQILPFS